MKKLTLTLSLIAALAFPFASCTKNQRAKNWGGATTVKLDRGEKLSMVTWKADNLWLLTEPMTSEDTPVTYNFKEDSSFGMLEGSIKIVESK